RVESQAPPLARIRNLQQGRTLYVTKYQQVCFLWRRCTMEKTAVLLVNLGTPAAPEPAAVRSYLAEFLGDWWVIDKPRWQWLPILHGIVLRTRPPKVARLYREIWLDEGSPLMHYSRLQQAALQERL